MGLAFCFACLTHLKDRVFPVVPQTTRGILLAKTEQHGPSKPYTCKMRRTVAITHKTFSTNIWYQQMNKGLLQFL